MREWRQTDKDESRWSWAGRAWGWGCVEDLGKSNCRGMGYIFITRSCKLCCTKRLDCSWRVNDWRKGTVLMIQSHLRRSQLCGMLPLPSNGGWIVQAANELNQLGREQSIWRTSGRRALGSSLSSLFSPYWTDLTELLSGVGISKSFPHCLKEELHLQWVIRCYFYQINSKVLFIIKSRIYGSESSTLGIRKSSVASRRDPHRLLYVQFIFILKLNLLSF